MRIGLLAIVGVLVCFGPGNASADQCESLRSAWVSVYQQLTQLAEQCLALRESSFQPRLEQLNEGRERGSTIARTVRTVLEERLNALNQAKRQVREAIERERLAFTEWRTCLARPRRGGPQAGNGEIQAAARERERLLRSVEDVLIDEAYVQYKHDRQPVAAEQNEPRQQQYYLGYGPYGQPLGYR
jgi:hypothetical protein